MHIRRLIILQITIIEGLGKVVESSYIEVLRGTKYCLYLHAQFDIFLLRINAYSKYEGLVSKEKLNIILLGPIGHIKAGF